MNDTGTASRALWTAHTTSWCRPVAGPATGPARSPEVSRETLETISASRTVLCDPPAPARVIARPRGIVHEGTSPPLQPDAHGADCGLTSRSARAHGVPDPHDRGARAGSDDTAHLPMTAPTPRRRRALPAALPTVQRVSREARCAARVVPESGSSRSCRLHAFRLIARRGASSPHSRADRPPSRGDSRLATQSIRAA